MWAANPCEHKIGDGRKSAYEIPRVARIQWVRTGLANHPTQMETPPQQMWFGSSNHSEPDVINEHTGSELADRVLPPGATTNHVPLYHKRLATGHDHPKGRCVGQHPTAQSGSCSLDLEHDLRRWREGSFREDVRVLCASRDTHSRSIVLILRPPRSQWTINVQYANLIDI